MRIQLVGGGNMGMALLSGLLKARWAKPKNLAVIEALPEARERLKADYPRVVVQADPLDKADAVLAVKPQDAETALLSLKQAGVRRVLSIAAGVKTAVIEKHLNSSQAAGSGAAVIRAMPNTPAGVGAGVSAIAPGSHADAKDMNWAEGILSSVGRVVRVEEELLDAVTGLSGSGPAYIFYLAEALLEAGSSLGISPEAAEVLIYQTIAGSAQMLLETGVSPEELRRQVTSPQGTTEQGIKALEEAKVKDAFQAAVQKAAARAREISSEII